MAGEGSLHDAGSVLAIPPTVVDQDRCESDDFDTRRRRSAAVSVVTAALIVLAVVVCAIYFQ